MIRIIKREKLLSSKPIEQIVDLLSTPEAERRGNSHKYEELKGYFEKDSSNNINITQLAIDLPEIQHEDSLKIVEEKCRSAYNHINSDQNGTEKYSILIEDTFMGFDEWNGLPGPYIKWFLKEMGPLGLHQMLSGFSNKAAKATCSYGIMNNPDEMIICQGSISGQIVSPRGDQGFGWDSCFQEDQTRLTFGEMNAETKRKHSHRSNAVFGLKYLMRLEPE